ncbi:tRNA preQ1(34) S-adenosylmethionine ribosyltransferase-isomerase QueA [Candidatus Ichthyocystis hellenicum]|uniref:tRNA preQ1(34) S-adenosylmethionine ribosyltransferase-isomerase QueA n=1 Tax=Candidatus Ichthyocystis hellenicum TaxID=1561003 RepID=UPI000A538C69|nr:tRNA preQ1(34) S-adenosylmethionine ribosyltransferase-isomerase QueA [Candidatus Ichthyocystis hellenicum]
MRFTTSDFDFEIDHGYIAQHPAENREFAKLMNVSDGEKIRHQFIYNLTDILTDEYLVVRNNTKVVCARLKGHKETRGQVEVFLERLIDNDNAIVQVKSHKKIKLPLYVFINENTEIKVKERFKGSFFVAESSNIMEIFNQYGEVPIPHYLKRNPSKCDKHDYQTVFASIPGAVAAPTAGLHFSQDLIERIKKKGVEFYDLTLHVGAGTFNPIRTENINDHEMHEEYYRIPNETRTAIESGKKNGKKILAIGTTVVRALESFAREEQKDDQWKSTRLFITPGFKFRTVDMLLTNFHLPKSSLIILASSFAGKDLLKECYLSAIKNNYRFFSYGDAMLLKRG